MLTLQEIQALDDADFKKLVEYVRFAIKQRNKTKTFVARQQFNKGDSVAFVGRDGSRKVGTVTKMGPKNVFVNVNGVSWRVHPTLLNKAV